MSRAHKKLNARRWEAVRRAVFERDGWRCTACGKAGWLEADHITPLQREPGQDPYDMDGLQTLCRNCHRTKTRRENRPLTGAERAWRGFVDEMLHGPCRGGHAELCGPGRS